jgi:hypothetical protein
MHLVQILLPLYDPTGIAFPQPMFRTVRGELMERFGGLTAYTRAPAKGLWKEDDQAPVAKDDIVVYEVMADALDRGWWSRYRQDLEGRFQQDALVIRAQEIELL